MDLCEIAKSTGSNGKTHLAVLRTDILDVFVHIAEDDGRDVALDAKHGLDWAGLARKRTFCNVAITLRRNVTEM